MSAVKYSKFEDARTHLKELFDAASVGRAAVVQRVASATALVDRDRFLSQLQHVTAPAFQLVPDEGRWLATVIGAGVAGEGDTAEQAVDDLIDALRDYAEDWGERLRHASNHRDSWALVQLVDLCSDDELHDWILGNAPR